MRTRRLEEMVGGWVVGDFEPSCFRTAACEVACKHYEAGHREPAHVHRVAAELTVIVSGDARMNGRHFTTGDIVMLDPGEVTDFEALTAVTTLVVKMPSVQGDKYLVEAGQGS